MYGSGGMYGGTGMSKFKILGYIQMTNLDCRANEVWNQCGLMCVQTCQNQAVGL